MDLREKSEARQWGLFEITMLLIYSDHWHIFIQYQKPESRVQMFSRRLPEYLKKQNNVAE